MDHTAGPILEIGVLLLAAVVAGWAARRIGLPAVVGYLAVGVLVSPFTPGYVADHDQLQLLADLGVVLLLFEVGIEVDIRRIHDEQRGLLLAAPLQTLLTTAAGAGVLLAAGLEPTAAALIGLSIAMSSSVVIVNITKSRRRTTDRSTEDALLGWSALQDSTGVALAAVLLALLGTGGRPLDQAAIGTLIEPSALRDGLGWLAIFLVLIVVAKVAVAYVLARIARLPARPVQLAVGLGQIGEFSFVLGSAAAAAGAITHERYVALIASVAISIAVSTVVVRLVGPRRARIDAVPPATAG
jgi:Kef-type K+ transport system membrane component KefB